MADELTRTDSSVFVILQEGEQEGLVRMGRVPIVGDWLLWEDNAYKVVEVILSTQQRAVKYTNEYGDIGQRIGAVAAWVKLELSNDFDAEEAISKFIKYQSSAR